MNPVICSYYSWARVKFRLKLITGKPKAEGKFLHNNAFVIKFVLNSIITRFYHFNMSVKDQFNKKDIMHFLYFFSFMGVHCTVHIRYRYAVRLLVRCSFHIRYKHVPMSLPGQLIGSYFDIQVCVSVCVRACSKTYHVYKAIHRKNLCFINLLTQHTKHIFLDWLNWNNTTSDYEICFQGTQRQETKLRQSVNLCM